MDMEPGHDWELLHGSNVTYRCNKCGILGHSVEKIQDKKKVKPNFHAPYNGECGLLSMSSVMNW